MTRAEFYARKNGGGFRTARKAFTCMQADKSSFCLRPVVPGDQYFDTRETTTWPQTKKICVDCAGKEV